MGRPLTPIADAQRGALSSDPFHPDRSVLPLSVCLSVSPSRADVCAALRCAAAGHSAPGQRAVPEDARRGGRAQLPAPLRHSRRHLPAFVDPACPRHSVLRLRLRPQDVLRRRSASARTPARARESRSPLAYCADRDDRCVAVLWTRGRVHRSSTSSTSTRASWCRCWVCSSPPSPSSYSTRCAPSTSSTKVALLAPSTGDLLRSARSARRRLTSREPLCLCAGACAVRFHLRRFRQRPPRALCALCAWRKAPTSRTEA